MSPNSRAMFAEGGADRRKPLGKHLTDDAGKADVRACKLPLRHPRLQARSGSRTAARRSRATAADRIAEDDVCQASNRSVRRADDHERAPTLRSGRCRRPVTCRLEPMASTGHHRSRRASHARSPRKRLTERDRRALEDAAAPVTRWIVSPLRARSARAASVRATRTTCTSLPHGSVHSMTTAEMPERV